MKSQFSCLVVGVLTALSCGGETDEDSRNSDSAEPESRGADREGESNEAAAVPTDGRGDALNDEDGPPAPVNSGETNGPGAFETILDSDLPPPLPPENGPAAPGPERDAPLTPEEAAAEGLEPPSSDPLPADGAEGSPGGASEPVAQYESCEACQEVLCGDAYVALGSFSASWRRPLLASLTR